MSLPTTSKVFVVQNSPVKEVDLGTGPNATFALKEDKLPELQDGEILVQVAFLSNDPAQRGWMQKDADPERAYAPPIKQGDPVASYAVSKVLASKFEGIKEGDLVNGRVGWMEYAVVKGNTVRVVQPIPGFSPSIFVGAFGGPGLTAYFGLTEILNLKKGQSIVVSGAAGAVGHIVVQYAKHVIGASKVVAIAGSKEKCDWLKKLGADYAINYKDASFEDDLIKATEGYVDAYFDNVGGSILNLMFARVKRYGVIAECGLISTYNDSSKSAYPNYIEIVKNRLTVRGFIVTDFLHRAGEGVQALSTALKEGKLNLEGAETLIEVPFEQIPATWGKLFTGENIGKLVTQIAKV